MRQKTKKYIAGILTAFACIIIGTQTTHAAVMADGQQLDVPQGSDASLNWSGYVSDATTTADQYTSVTGTWMVPAVSASSVDSADATWVGIGGVESHDLVQAGTQAIVQNGTVTYSAWVETLPGFSKTVSLPVQVGDSITSTLTEESPGQWLVTISNNTSGKQYSTTVAYDSSHSSAEWVEEMVTNSNGTFRPLDSFGSITFSNAAATINGTSENLLQLQAKPLQMVNRSNQALAVTSSLATDNAGFSVTRSTAAAEQAPVAVTMRRSHRGYSASGGYYTIIGIPFTFTIVRQY